MSDAKLLSTLRTEANPADGDLLTGLDVSEASPSLKNANFTILSLATFILSKLGSLSQGEVDSSDGQTGKLISAERLKYAILKHAPAGITQGDVTSLIESALAGIVGLKHKVDATTEPSTGDDSEEGYSVSSLWYRPAENQLWVLVDPTEDAAVWYNLTPVEPSEEGGGAEPINHKLDASAAPTENDDETADYVIGSLWYWVVQERLWLLLDATEGAAVWYEITPTEPSEPGGGDANPAMATKAEMEAGTESERRGMSPLLVAQAIAELAQGGGINISGLNYRGGWQYDSGDGVSGIEYMVGDFVLDVGKWYLCIDQYTTDPQGGYYPSTDTEHWELLLEGVKGDKGDKGDKGVKGDPGGWETGDLRHSFRSTAGDGWVLCSGTIGKAGSSATRRANADCEDLFTLLWNSMADAQAPVSGGRGASAAADFAAGKTIQLVDTRGRVFVGIDYTIGGNYANAINPGGTGASNLDAQTLGAGGGVDRHTLTGAQSGTSAHSHAVSYHRPTNYQGAGSLGGVSNIVSSGGSYSSYSSTTTAADASEPHPIVQPAFVGYWYIKL